MNSRRPLRASSQRRLLLIAMAWLYWLGMQGANVPANEFDVKVAGQLAAIAMSPSGSHLAVASTADVGAPTKLDLWDLSGRKGIQISLAHRSEPARSFLFFSPDQKSLIVCTDEIIQSIDRSTGKLGAKLQNEVLLRAVNGWMLTLHKKGSPQFRIYDVNTLELLHRLDCPSGISPLYAESSNNFAIAEDHSAIAYASDTTIQVIDFPANKARKKLVVTHPVDGIALSSDGKRLAAVSENRFLPIFEWPDLDQPPMQLASPNPQQSGLAHARLFPIHSLSFLNADGVCISTSGATGLWSIAQKKFTDVAPMPHGRSRARVTIASGYCMLHHLAIRLGGDDKLEILTDPHRNWKEFNAEPYGKVNFAHSSDGERLAFAIDNSTVAVRSSQATGEKLERIASAKHTAEGGQQFLFSHDSKLVALGQDRNLKLQAIYEVETGKEFPAELPFFMRNGGNIHSRNQNVKGPNICSNPGPLSAAYLDSATKEISFLGMMHWQGVRAKALTPYQKLLYMQPIRFRIPLEGGLARVDKLKPSKEVWLRLMGHTSDAFQIQDGTRAMVLETELREDINTDVGYRKLTGNSQLALFNLETGEIIRVLTTELKPTGFKRGMAGQYGSLLVSPDGSTLVVPGAQRRVRMWNLQSGAELENDFAYDPGDGKLTFAGNGRYLCVTEDRNPIVIFDVQTKQAINPVAVSDDGLDQVVAICPTHQRYLSQNPNGMLAWRNLLDGKLISRPASHNSQLLGGAFSHDGSVLATLSADRELRFWRVPSPVEVVPKSAIPLGPLGASSK